MRARCLPLALLAPLLSAGCGGAEPVEPVVPPEPMPATEAGERMDWWRDARFGLFLHWGLYAVPAGKWGDRDSHGEWIMTTAQIPVEEYEQFVPRFDPVGFDADAWARMAKAAGMKYVVITTKHHDGFALFDSAVSDYDVMATPFQRDIMAELAEACRAHGLKICWYHSIMDWHHPDYLPRRGWEERRADGADFERYVEYLHAQVTELLTNYGDIGVMWFDGEWEATWNHGYGQALYELCRTLQPDVIVNNRVDVGRAGMAGFTEGGGRAGDFGTPEQEIPATGVPGADWETCMTMNRNWGFNAADDDWKSSTDLIRKLVDIASKGGNFLLNVGPRADGTFPPEAVERLAAIGAWMDVNGEAIHGTQASPIDAPDWGRVTMKTLHDGSTMLYLHVFDWPANDTLTLSGLGNTPVAFWMLGEQEEDIQLQREWGQLQFQLPGGPTNPHATVLAVHLDGAPMIYRPPSFEAAGEQFLDALEVTLTPPSAGIEVRYEVVPGGPVDRAGPIPGTASGQVWNGTPLRLTVTSTVRAQSYHDGMAVSDAVERTYTRVEPLAAGDFAAGEPGLAVEQYSGQWDVLPDFATLQPVASMIEPAPALPTDFRDENIARVYHGLVDVPTTGMWHFGLESDDGARLWIDGVLVVDNDGLHGPAEERGAVALEGGMHRIRVEWFNRGGGALLGLRWGQQSGPLEVVPVEIFRQLP